MDDGKGMYLVTAKHVLYKAKSAQQITPQAPDTMELEDQTATLISPSKDPTELTQNVFAIDLAKLEQSGKIKRHSIEDVVVVKLAVITSKSSDKVMALDLSPGIKNLRAAKTGIVAVARENIKKFDETLVGNEIVVFGYPSSLGLQAIPQIDYQHPLLRKGIVAGKNLAKRSIILDCPIYFGNSGGPAVEIDRQGLGAAFNIIGVVTQYVPFLQQASSLTLSMQLYSNSGYAVVEPMDFILELLD